MSKKVLIWALFTAFLASSVGGVLEAQADNVYPYGGLTCSPASGYVNSGDLVNFYAYYSQTGGQLVNGQLAWQAVGGTPSNGYGNYFSTRFYTASLNETRVVTVSDGYQTATCNVYVQGNVYYTPTPTPYYQTLQCTPAYAYVNSGASVYLSATGGNGIYYWSAPNGSPASGYNQSFATTFYNNYSSNYTNQVVTVTSGGQSATCNVQVNGSYYSTPTPTPYYSGYVSMDHSITNLTRGGSGVSVTAYNGDRLQFSVRLTTNNQPAYDAHIRDWLPQYVSYQTGSTTVNGASYPDGIATGRDTDSLGIAGTLNPNQTYTINFTGILNGAPNTTLTNSVNAQVQGSTYQNRTSTISVIGSAYSFTPTPTPMVNSYASLAVTQYGRNVSNGQTGQNTAIKARGNNTLDLVVHVRNNSSQTDSNVYLTNILPTGLRYVTGSTTVNNVVVGDGVTSTGINLGTLFTNQEALVKLSATVDPAMVPTLGQVTVYNTVQARADNVATVSTRFPIVLADNLALATIGQVRTGPADSVILALLAGLLATGLYAAYTRTNSFGRRYALAQIQQSVLSKRTPNFSR